MKLFSKYTIILTASLVVLSMSCSKMEDNGDLGGHWQLTEWRDNTGSAVVLDNSSQLFYTIQLELIQFRFKAKERYGCLAYFEHKGDSLIITKAFQQKANTDSLLQDMTSLKKYGVSADGRFKIDNLNSGNMTLRNELGTLNFIKY